MRAGLLRVDAQKPMKKSNRTPDLRCTERVMGGVRYAAR